MPGQGPRPAAGSRRVRGAARPGGLVARLRGPWRVGVANEVAGADDSMRPAVEPGDWLLVDPTIARWPAAGTAVVFREPGGGALALKRIAAGPGERVPFAGGWLDLAADEAWLLGDASDAELADRGAGAAIDSRRYGPVPVAALLGRVVGRYGPPGRPWRIAPAPAGLLERNAVVPAPPPDAGPGGAPPPPRPADPASPVGDPRPPGPGR